MQYSPNFFSHFGRFGKIFAPVWCMSKGTDGKYYSSCNSACTRYVTVGINKNDVEKRKKILVLHQSLTKYAKSWCRKILKIGEEDAPKTEKYEYFIIKIIYWYSYIVARSGHDFWTPFWCCNWIRGPPSQECISEGAPSPQLSCIIEFSKLEQFLQSIYSIFKPDQDSTSFRANCF